MLALGIDQRPYYAYNIVEALLTTAHLVPLFIAGMLAALYSNRIIDTCRKLQDMSALHFGLWLLCCLVDIGIMWSVSAQ